MLETLDKPYLRSTQNSFFQAKIRTIIRRKIRVILGTSANRLDLTKLDKTELETLYTALCRKQA
jgi:hypothetical protein